MDMTEGRNLDLRDYRVGMRIELSPATDSWMFGDRYGRIEKIGRKYLHVRMDRSGRLRQTHPLNIYKIVYDASGNVPSDQCELPASNYYDGIREI